MAEMKIGPLNYEERGTLKEIIRRQKGAFAFTPDDIGLFTGFTYPLRYKKDADPRKAHTNPYNTSIDTQKAVSEWIERMYKAGVIKRTPPHI